MIKPFNGVIYYTDKDGILYMTGSNKAVNKSTNAKNLYTLGKYLVCEI